MLICAWTTLLSVLLVVTLEKHLVYWSGKPPPRWKRLLIPVPVLFIIASNLDAVRSFGVWSEAHQGVYFRYFENNDWDPDRLLKAGLLSAVIIAPLLCKPAGSLTLLTLFYWVGNTLLHWVCGSWLR